MGTTPGRTGVQGSAGNGMVRRLVRMFKGEHPPAALQAIPPERQQQLGYVLTAPPAHPSHTLNLSHATAGFFKSAPCAELFPCNRWHSA